MNPEVPAGLVRSLAVVGTRPKMVLLLRHADREPIPAGSWGDDVPLNELGFRRTAALRSVLQQPCWVVSSEIHRCRQTAAALSDGAPDGVATSRLLGAPGAFVVDPTEAGRHFQALGPRGVVQKLIAGVPLTGTRPASEGVELLSGLIARLMSEHSGVGVCVSHDSILATLVGVLFGELFESRWVDFLDGAVITYSADGLLVAWDGMVREVSL